MATLKQDQLQYFRDKIIERYRAWYKENKKGKLEDNLNLNSYNKVQGGGNYSLILESFEDLVFKNVGFRKFQVCTLVNLFYESKKKKEVKFQDSILRSFELYINSGKKEDKKYYTATLQEFTTAFEYWDEVDPGTYLEANLFKRVVKLLKYDKLDRRKQVFFVLNAVHYGDRILVEMIKNNPNRKDLLSLLFDFVSNKGVREGWRAEYFLSEMEPTIIVPFLKEKEKGADAGLMEKIERIRTKGLLPYLKEIIARNEPKKDYALMVLKQLEVAAMDNLG